MLPRARELTHPKTQNKYPKHISTPMPVLSRNSDNYVYRAVSASYGEKKEIDIEPNDMFTYHHDSTFIQLFYVQVLVLNSKTNRRGFRVQEFA